MEQGAHDLQGLPHDHIQKNKQTNIYLNGSLFLHLSQAIWKTKKKVSKTYFPSEEIQREKNAHHVEKQSKKRPEKKFKKTK